MSNDNWRNEESHYYSVCDALTYLFKMAIKPSYLPKCPKIVVKHTQFKRYFEIGFLSGFQSGLKLFLLPILSSNSWLTWTPNDRTKA